MQSLIENLKPNQHKTQGFCPPPPLRTRERKPPENCFRSYIDQIQNGFYSSSKLIRNVPQKTSDSYFVIKTRATSIRSYRRNYSHRSVALFRTKRDGSTRANIAYMTCSFLELDGATDGRIKTINDVNTLIEKNSLPTPSYVIQTSQGHYHVIWNYSRALPWTTKGESFWTSQQKRKIELFKQGGFLVDKGASLNPCQNLRNPSQLQPYNFKRRCEVHIYKSYQKTSLRAIYRALNRTTIANPKRLSASVLLRRYLRANKAFTLTHAELAITLGTCIKTVQREVRRAVQNGDLLIIARLGNNKRFHRRTEYTSNLYIEPNSQKGHLSISKDNSLKQEALLKDFQAVGAENGRRNRTLFAIGQYLKAKLGKQASIGAIRDALEGGAVRCHVSVREFERALQNVMKPIYDHPLSLSKLRAWDLIEETKHFH